MKATKENLVKQRADVEECCARLLRLSGAINAWTTLFSSQNPDRGEHWTAIDSNLTEIIAIADEIADAGEKCVALATSEWGEGCGSEKCADLKHTMERAGSKAMHLREVALNRLGWSSGWRTWDNIHCESDAAKIFTACRDGLQNAYKLKGKSTADARVALVTSRFTVGEDTPPRKPAGNDNSIDDWFEQVEGFKLVRWGGEQFPPLARNAQKAVAALYNDRRNGGAGLTSKELREAADSSSDTVRSLFKINRKGSENTLHPAWCTMVRYDGDRYRLVSPSEHAADPNPS